MNLLEDKELLELAATLRQAKAKALEARRVSLAANEAADAAIKDLLSARNEEDFAANAFNNAMEQRFRAAVEDLTGE